MRNRALVVVTPNTGQTAGVLFVRTFGKNPRPGGKGAAEMGPPNYYE